MASLDEVIEEMKSIFNSNGYTCLDDDDFGHQKVAKLKDSDYPVIFISGDDEENDDAPLINFLINTAPITLNVALNTGQSNLKVDGRVELRKIKNLIYTNSKASSFWTKWGMTANKIAQLQGSNDRSKVYGGIGIITEVQYRELQIL